MRGAFKVVSALDPRRRYLVLDDVVTTGATLGATREALLDAGHPVDRITLLALAYQP